MMKKVRLQWLVDGDTEWGHLSTIDVMYVDAETGELIGEILPYGLGDWGRRIFDRKERNIPCRCTYFVVMKVFLRGQHIRQSLAPG